MHDDGIPAVEQYLVAVRDFSPPRPITILAYDLGAPCGKVDAIRKLMIEHLGCGRQNVCVQGTG
jgi:hypothetical protein